MNIQEEILNILPSISSLNNLFDENLNPDSKISFNDKIRIFTKKIFDIRNIRSTNKASKNRQDLIGLDLNIPFENYEILMKDRSNSIKKGILENPKWVNGNILYKNKFLKAKFRLKGLREDHWLANSKFSLKVNLKDGKNILGMNSFSLHKLRSRQYPHEYIFQELISEMGFPSLNHELVRINMNNNYWGVMDMQDTFGKEMIGRNKLVESLIIEFSDKEKIEWENFIYNYPNLNQSKKWLYHPRMFFKLVNKDLDDLNSQEKFKLNYLKNRLKETDYQNILFDNLKLSNMEEILSIWGSFHTANLDNLKFYLNPFTLKLEPLMFDQEKFEYIDNISNVNSIQKITKGFLKPNTLSLEERNKIYKKTLFALDKRIPYSLSSKYFPLDKNINIELPKKNYELLVQSNLKFRLSREDTYFVDRYKCNNNSVDQLPNNLSLINADYNKNELNIMPLLCGKIFIKEVKLCDEVIFKNIFLNQSEIFISKPIKLRIDKKISNKITTENNCNNFDNNIIYNYNGKKYVDNIIFLPSLERSINPLINEIIPSFIDKNNERDFVTKKGIWEIKKPIIIKGNLFINQNTILNFHPNTYLIVKGNLNIKGSEKYPVVMQPINESNNWKGLYVYNEEQKKSNLSNINYLKIYNTEKTNIGVLNLTGGTTFYNTNLIVRNLKIFNSNAEDSLNIVKSNVDIKDIFIDNSYSDGLDCDFCKGIISNIKLSNIGGDGVDFSGSNLRVDIDSALKIKDKVASIGEETNISIEIDNVDNSYLAVAVKDGSRATIFLKNIITSGPYIMAYDKKTFFRKRTIAKVRHYNSIFEKELDKYITSYDADLEVNNLNISPSNVDVEKLYKTGPMKK